MNKYSSILQYHIEEGVKDIKLLFMFSKASCNPNNFASVTEICVVICLLFSITNVTTALDQ